MHLTCKVTNHSLCLLSVHINLKNMINKPAETIQKKLVAQENKVEYLTVSSRMNVFQRFDNNCLVSINNISYVKN